MRKLEDVQSSPDRPEKQDSPMWKELRRLRKLSIYPRHRGINISERRSLLWAWTDADSCTEERSYVIDGFLKQGAKEYKFQLRNKQTGAMETASIYEYFLKRYDVTLIHPEFPLVQTTKKGVVFPMEVVVISENQKYPYKLDEIQVSEMSTPHISRAGANCLCRHLR